MNGSREQLVKSSDRRIKHLMVGMLEKFENLFPQAEQTKNGSLFKSDIKTAFNDVMRAQRDEFNDYEIEYRPIRMGLDNTLTLTRSFLESIQKIDFIEGIKPSIRIYSSIEKAKIMDALRKEFSAGVLYIENQLILEIVGIDSCINNVIPLMDKYNLNEGVRQKYRIWRNSVVNQYRS